LLLALCDILDCTPNDLVEVAVVNEQTRKSAIATFEAIRLIKQNLPGALTHVGLSNCSFGLNPYTRQVLNSVYLHYALEYGLDSAILHAAKIMPLASIDEKGKELCRRFAREVIRPAAPSFCIALWIAAIAMLIRRWLTEEKG